MPFLFLPISDVFFFVFNAPGPASWLAASAMYVAQEHSSSLAQNESISISNYAIFFSTYLRFFLFCSQCAMHLMSKMIITILSV
jgi:hypothetical protein